ncbi:MAG TPA: transposase [Actinophytocola sp.]|nr:transposase [Actinophytocola sp.]
MRRGPCSGSASRCEGYGPSAGRSVVEATAWRFRTGAPWRDLPGRFGNWNDGKGRALAFVLTGDQVADTIMLPDALDEIRVTGATGRPRQRPDRRLGGQGLPVQGEPGVAARARHRHVDPGT